MSVEPAKQFGPDALTDNQAADVAGEPQPADASQSDDAAAQKIVEFTPESAMRRPAKLVNEIYQNVMAGRALAWRMFRRNIKGMYRQTLLGLFWAFLPPLAHTALWVFLSSQGVTNFAKDIGSLYPIYVLSGMVLWQSFVEGLQAPLNVVQANRHMLSKLRFPRESVLMVGVYETFFNLTIRTLVLIPLLLWFGAAFGPSLLLAVLGGVLLILLGVGIGCFLMPVGMLYQDVGKFLVVAMPVWMLTTQIVWPAPKGWADSPFNWANPASPLLLFTRDLLVLGSSDHWFTAGIYAAAAVPLCLLGLLIFRVSVPILVERVSS